MSRQPARSQKHRAESKPEASPGLSSSSQYASSYFTAPSSPYISPYSPLSAQPTTTIISPQPTTSFDLSPWSVEASAIGSRAASAAAMSTYSSSSQGSIYSNTSPQQHRVATPGMMNNPESLSANDKERLIKALRTHQVNTLTELRRIEKLFASLNSVEVTEPMTSAWAYYVNSNNLLNELRGLTRNYPFDSECLDEAKHRVVDDPASTRSWNYCWLLLTKIKNENLISKHARLLAAKPIMWGGKTPTAAGVQKLATACTTEWTRAVDQMLRSWTTSPSTTGR